MTLTSLLNRKQKQIIMKCYLVVIVLFDKIFRILKIRNNSITVVKFDGHINVLLVQVYF